MNNFMSAFEEDKADPRSKDLFLSSSFWPVLVIVTIYAIVVRVIGPKFMENREPYDVKIPIIIINSFQVIVNLYVSYGLGSLCWLSGRYNWS